MMATNETITAQCDSGVPKGFSECTICQALVLLLFFISAYLVYIIVIVNCKKPSCLC